MKHTSKQINPVLKVNNGLRTPRADHMSPRTNGRLIFLNVTEKVVCYLGSWSTYRPGNGQFEVENIDPFLCTHVIFSFIGLNYDGTVRILDSWNEIDKGNTSLPGHKFVTKIKIK